MYPSTDPPAQSEYSPSQPRTYASLSETPLHATPRIVPNTVLGGERHDRVCRLSPEPRYCARAKVATVGGSSDEVAAIGLGPWSRSHSNDVGTPTPTRHRPSASQHHSSFPSLTATTRNTFFSTIPCAIANKSSQNAQFHHLHLPPALSLSGCRGSTYHGSGRKRVARSRRRWCSRIHCACSRHNCLEYVLCLLVLICPDARCSVCS